MLLFLLVSPLLVSTSQPPQNVNDLSIWLAKWNIQTTDEFVILGERINGTSQQNIQLQEDIEILKGRLAIAAIFSSVYMVISTLFMIVYLAVFVKKSVKKHQLKRQEEEVELMDQRLQERRERRRAAARAKSSSPRQQ